MSPMAGEQGAEKKKGSFLNTLKTDNKGSADTAGLLVPRAGSQRGEGRGGFCAEFKAPVKAPQDHCIWAKESSSPYQKGGLDYPPLGSAEF